MGPKAHPHPNKLQEWKDFPLQRETAYTKLDKIFYPNEDSEIRVFDSFEGLDGIKEYSSGRRIVGEMNFLLFQHSAVENSLTRVINSLVKDKQHSSSLGLEHKIAFDEQDNALKDTAEEVQDRLETTQQVTNKRSIIPDRFCIFYIEGKRWRIPPPRLYAPVGLLPNKLSLSMFEVGLHEMDILKEVIERSEATQDTEGNYRHCAEYLVAAALSQAYTYMLQGGLEFGCVDTGEAIVFLKVDEKDPLALHYHLSVASQDIRSVDGVGFAHPLTAVGQLLSFVLMAA